MATLYIRQKPTQWLTFINSLQDFRDFVDSYIPGRPLILADLSTFSPTLLQSLLKLIEENPSLSCYSSTDLCSPILLSRFTHIVKQPPLSLPSLDPQSFRESKRDYSSALALSLPPALTLRVPLSSPKFDPLIY